MSQYQVEWCWAMLEGSVQRGRSPWKHSSEQILRTVLTKDQIQNCSPKKQTSDWFQIPRPILIAKFKIYFARVIFKRRTTFSIDITVQLCSGPLYDEDNNFFVLKSSCLFVTGACPQIRHSEKAIKKGVDRDTGLFPRSAARAGHYYYYRWLPVCTTGG